MSGNPVPRAVRQLLIVSSAFLLASLVISGVNAYVTLASPAQSPYVPSTVGFEGQLADAEGAPVADGDYTITFSLYSVETGGTALWSEAQTVAVTDGLYSVQLGSVNALDPDDFSGDRWLGIQVSGDSEMTPRIPISAVPFALNARQAMGLQGNDVSTQAPSNGDMLRWDGTSWVPGEGDLPAGAIILVEGACPAGFTEYTDARGRYVVGVPLDGTIGAVVGTALSDQENRPVGQHTHTITDPGHTHTGAYTGQSKTQDVAWANHEVWVVTNVSTGSTGSSTTGITIDNSGDVEGTNAPYIQLRLCQREP